MGLPAMAPMALQAGMGLLKGMAGGGGAAAAPAAGGTPFDAAFKPPMPEMNPMMHDLGPKGPSPAAPARLIAGANDPTKTPYDLIKAGGHTNETVQGREIDPAAPAPGPLMGGSPPPTAGLISPPERNPMMHSMDMPKTSAGGGITDIPMMPPNEPAPVAPVQAATNGVKPADESGGLFGKLLPASWRGTIGDLQDKLGDAPGNPLFQTGMGLLASGYDGSNPYSNILKGLGGVQPHQIAGQEADTKSADRAKEQELQALLMKLGLQFGGAGGTGVMTPPPSRQAAGQATLIR